MMTRQLVLILFWSILTSAAASGQGAFDPPSSTTRTHFADHDEPTATNLPSYEIVTPIKVSETGRFLSHDLSHAHASSGRGFARGKQTRRKRETETTGKWGTADQLLHYSLYFDGKHHMVQLEPNRLFLAPQAVVERRSRFDPSTDEESHRIGNVTSRTSVIGPHAQCHFEGRVLNQTFSKVALSTCDGLKGFLRTDRGDFLIEPLQSPPEGQDEPHPHKVYRRSLVHSESRANAGDGQCGSQEFEKAFKDREEWEKGRQGGDEEGRRKRRRKRSVSVERNVEVLVVADKKMIDFYTNEDLNTYILTIMNMVSTIYHDASIGNMVNIIVVKIMLLETPQYEEELEISHDADGTLLSFCRWQQMVNPSSENHPHHHDVAVLLTRYNICSQSNSHCSTLGLAEIAGMCQPHRSCNVNEDTGLQIAYTIAHEIGHNFGMDHDSASNGCGSSYGVSLYVMSPHLATDIIPITWSNCSRVGITNFLDRDWGSCLVDEPPEVEYNFPQLPPGAMYDADHQCRLAFGASAKRCTGMEIECQTLWCQVDNRCVTRLEPAAEGTQCGKHKWCYYGKCVTMGERPAAIHGSWGQWSTWSSCSRSCGAGVEVASRHCANPAPANGGKYCTGDRRRYRICNTQDCPDNGISFRAVQCSEFDNKPYKDNNYTWGPVTLENSPCQLHCKPDNEFYSVELRDIVEDGTPCKPGTRDMCINGICKRVSCDWTIEGTAQEDRCGLCHGDGTQCVTTAGNFTLETSVSYVRVVTFPVGAMKVRVEEMGDAANYFAIKDEQKGKFYLNGNWIIQWSGEYSASGVMLYYKRENETETLFMPGPLKKPLTFMLLFQTHNPGLKWEYTLPHENATYTPEFHWRSSDWSVCSRTCGGGTQASKPMCMESEAGLVEDKYCEKEERPEERKRECNSHACPAWWWSGPWQPCSITCGNHGNRRRTVICVRSYGPTEQMALLDSDCSMNLKPHEEEQCPDLTKCLTDVSWSVGPWIEACRGDPCEFERREVRCLAQRGPCDPLTKPSDVRQCGNVTCGHWEAGEWDECSTTCGEGVQIRNVECVGGSACARVEEPGSVKECQVEECHSTTHSTNIQILQENLPETYNEIESTKNDKYPSETQDDVSVSILTTDVSKKNITDEVSQEITASKLDDSQEDGKHHLDDEKENEIPTDASLRISENKEMADLGSDDRYPTNEAGNPNATNLNEPQLDSEDEKVIEEEGIESQSVPINNIDDDFRNETEFVESGQNDNKQEDGEPETDDKEAKEKEEKKNTDVLVFPQDNKDVTQSDVKPSNDSSKGGSEGDSFTDYELTSDEYYEFDPQEDVVNKSDPDVQEVETKQAIEGELEDVNNEVRRMPSGETDSIGTTESSIEERLEINETVVNLDEGNKDVNGSSTRDVPKKPQVTNATAPTVQIPHESSLSNLTTSDIRDNEIHDDYDYSDEMDYDYGYDDYTYDDSYYDEADANETLPERPSGIVEDKLDIDALQVIEVRLRRNKKGGKHRHNKVKKNKIKKVKVHTGADAIRVLNKMAKKASKSPSTGLEPGSNEVEPDYSIYKWTIGTWAECSEPCGGGFQRRSVECHNSSTEIIVPPWKCHSLPPPDLQHCNMFPCLNWTVTSYGPCSASCGPGTQSRNASCSKAGRCHERDMPPLQRQCQESPCVRWVEGPWSMCTKSCGAGYQIRYVKCVDVKTQKASQECQEERPPHKRVCNANKCNANRQGQQNHCKDSLHKKLCKRLIHMCATKFFRIKCCKTCHRRLG